MLVWITRLNQEIAAAAVETRPNQQVIYNSVQIDVVATDHHPVCVISDREFRSCSFGRGGSKRPQTVLSAERVLTETGIGSMQLMGQGDQATAFGPVAFVPM